MTDLCDERTPAAASARSRFGRVRPPRPRAPILRNPRRGRTCGCGRGGHEWTGMSEAGVPAVLEVSPRSVHWSMDFPGHPALTSVAPDDAAR